MTEREELVRNLFRQIEKDKLKMIKQLSYKLDTLLYTSNKGNKKISMMIKIEKEDN